MGGNEKRRAENRRFHTPTAIAIDIFDFFLHICAINW